MTEDQERSFIVSGRYRIERALGQGGMGVVYEAFDVSLDRRVALKMIHPHLAADSTFTRRFEIEARAVARLDHPNLLRLHDFNSDGGRFYMVLQYLEGETLQARMDEGDGAAHIFSLDEAASIILDVCEGLSHAHALNLIHRDIKPANLMLLPEPRVVLMDFGIAKMLDETSVTAHGSVMGTALYMSPEQIRGETADRRSDIYSLGVILYQMLAGRCPFLADSHPAVMMMHLNSPVPDLRDLNQHLPPAVALLIEKALAKDRDARFQTTGEFAAALRDIPRDMETEIVTILAAPREPLPANVNAPPGARLIRYDHTTQEDRLRSLLGDFTETLRRDDFSEVLGRDFIKRVSDAVIEIDRRLATDFNVVVMGDFKRGKSTFINALLGSAVVTTDVVPETVTVNRIRYGPALKVEACFADGGHLELQPGELKAERLNKIISRLPEKPLHLQIEAPVDWLRGVQLVDTPGLNDFLSDQDSLVHQCLHDADAVLYMISALAPLSESERMFLRHTLRPYEFSKVCFLLNRLDALDTKSDVLRVVEATQNRLCSIFPNAKLFGISAAREFKRAPHNSQSSAAAGDYLDASFETLREYLNESLILNRDLIQVERGVALVDQLLRDCEANVRRLKASVEASKVQVEELIRQCENKNSELYRRIDEHKERVRARIEGLGEQAAGWMAEFIKRFQREVISNLETFKNEDVQKHFPVFLSDSFHQALTQCVDAHQAAIAEVLHADDSLLSELSRGGDILTAPVFTDNPTSHASFNSGQWTVVDSVQFALWYTGFDSTFTKLLTGLVSGKFAARENLARYRLQLNQSLPDLQNSVATLIREKYKDIAVRVDEVIDAAYRQQIASVVSALRQALGLRSAGEMKADEANKVIDRILDGIEHARTEAQEFHRQLQMYGQNRVVELLDE